MSWRSRNCSTQGDTGIASSRRTSSQAFLPGGGEGCSEGNGNREDLPCRSHEGPAGRTFPGESDPTEDPLKRPSLHNELCSRQRNSLHETPAALPEEEQTKVEDKKYTTVRATAQGSGQQWVADSDQIDGDNPRIPITSR